MADEQDRISHETIFKVLAADAGGYYKLILTVASALLGGSLLFLEKIIPHPTPAALVFMALGWMSLVASVALITSVRQKNLRSSSLALKNKLDEARQLDAVTDRRSERAAWSLIAGLSFIVLAGIVAPASPGGTGEGGGLQGAGEGQTGGADRVELL